MNVVKFLSHVIGWAIVSVSVGVITGNIGGSFDKKDRKAWIIALSAFLSGIVSNILIMA